VISLIICSRTPQISDILKANIGDTVGVPFEIITIDNSANSYNIFQAYNIGVSRSKYPYLCFMHDDIEYKTTGWGQKVAAHFADEKTGAIGIGGSPYMPAMPGSWWAGGLVNENIIKMQQNVATTMVKYADNQPAGQKEVVVLDGVWMCIRRSLFDKISFDEVHFKGFHYYDLDISLQVQQQGYKLYCVFDVLLEHFGIGNMNSTWADNARAFRNKWASVLPVSAVKVTYAKASDIALKTLNEYVQVLLSNNVPKKKAFRMGFAELVKFYKGYFYYKTPGYLYRYAVKALL
jgi:hypothetical protein